ncbi:hypothetical protein [Francisella philomiragia]|uniref:hypothetical protein n=1 Tax=Francisella philomiragia TaxID=28110 RepID=UPI0005CB167E|nr:hypothetical protein [Francisella philomiragia]
MEFLLLNNEIISILVTLIVAIMPLIIAIILRSTYFKEKFDKHSFDKYKYDELEATFEYCLNKNNPSSVKKIKAYKYKLLFDIADIQKIFVRIYLINFLTDNEINSLFLLDLIKFGKKKWIILPIIRKSGVIKLIKITVILAGITIYIILMAYLQYMFINSLNINYYIFIAVLAVYFLTILALISSLIFLYFEIIKYVLISLYIVYKVKRKSLVLKRRFYEKNDYKELQKYF